MDDDFESAMKVIVIGDGGSGKTSLAQRYCAGVFSSEYKKTLGVDFLERTIKVGDITIRLMLWDTAGQEEFDALTKAYYRGAEGAVLVFSTTDRESFQNVDKWKKKVEFECGSIPMALVQNKVDLSDHRQVKSEEIDKLVKRTNLPLFLTSAKKNIGIEEVFAHLSKAYLDSLNEPDEDEEEEDMRPQVSSFAAPTGQSSSGSSFFKKYPKSNFMARSRKVFRDHLYHPMAPGHHHSMTAPLLANGRQMAMSNSGGHFNYKSRFHLIPIHSRTTPHPIMVHHHPHPQLISGTNPRGGHPSHHPYQPHHLKYVLRDAQGRFVTTTNKPIHRRRKSSDSFFKNNCWLL